MLRAEDLEAFEISGRTNLDGFSNKYYSFSTIRTKFW